MQGEFLDLLQSKFDQNFETLHGDISQLSALSAEAPLYIV